MEGRKDGRTEGRKDGRTEGRKDGRTERWGDAVKKPRGVFCMRWEEVTLHAQCYYARGHGVKVITRSK